MIIDLYDGKIDRTEYLKQMRQMDVDFPGIGWAASATDLERFWEAQAKVRNVIL